MPPPPSLQQWYQQGQAKAERNKPPVVPAAPRLSLPLLLCPGSREEALDEAHVPHGLHDEVAALQQPVGLVGPLHCCSLGTLLLPEPTGLLGTAQHSKKGHQPACSLMGAPPTATAEQFPACMDLFITNYSDEDSLLSPLTGRQTVDDKQHLCATLSYDMHSVNTEFGEHQGTNPELFVGHLSSYLLEKISLTPTMQCGQNMNVL